MSAGDQRDEANARGPAIPRRWRFCPRPARGSPLIGLDVGSKTVGLALSDVTRNIASGLVTLRRTRFTADARASCSLLQPSTASAGSWSACR